MKGMILAAGLGSRMGPISDYIAKPAVPFLGVPMIEHSIGVLRSAGIKDIIVNLHHRPDSIKSILGDGSRLDVNISYSHEKQLLGSGGGIGKVREFFEDEPFVVINSDILIDIDIGEVIESHRASECAATMVLREDPEKKYGVVQVDETHRVRKIEGFPKELDFHGGSEYMFAGVHVIEPVWFDYTPDTDRFESFSDVYAPMMLDGKRVNAYILQGRWIDIGSARRYLEASLDQLIGNIIPNKCKPGPGNSIKNSILTSDTKLAEHVELEGVIFLGEATVGNDCKLAESIICPGAEVADGTKATRCIFYKKTSVALSDIRD